MPRLARHLASPAKAATKAGGVPRSFKPPRDRAVKTKDAVDCPDCPAITGEFCRNAAGENLSTCHRARRRMAVRKENEAR